MRFKYLFAIAVSGLLAGCDNSQTTLNSKQLIYTTLVQTDLKSFNPDATVQIQLINTQTNAILFDKTLEKNVTLPLNLTIPAPDHKAALDVITTTHLRDHIITTTTTPVDWQKISKNRLILPVLAQPQLIPISSKITFEELKGQPINCTGSYTKVTLFDRIAVLDNSQRQPLVLERTSADKRFDYADDITLVHLDAQSIGVWNGADKVAECNNHTLVANNYAMAIAKGADWNLNINTDKSVFDFHGNKFVLTSSHPIKHDKQLWQLNLNNDEHSLELVIKPNRCIDHETGDSFPASAYLKFDQNPPITGCFKRY